MILRKWCGLCELCDAGGGGGDDSIRTNDSVSETYVCTGFFLLCDSKLT